MKHRNLDTDTVDARPSEDPASFDLLALFSVMWGASALFHLYRGSTVLDLLRLDLEAAATAALGFFALAVLLRPRSVELLVCLAASQIAEYALSMPIGSNHYTIMFFMNVAICGAYLCSLLRRSPGKASRDAFFGSWAPVGRYLLVLTYFFSVVHKLNTDWFDPSVSCAVALTDSLLVPWGLKSPLIDWFVIYGTLFAEGLAMVLLCIPRLKYLGFLVGMPLHIVIGLVPYAMYPNFSSLTFALYALFLPDDFPSRLRAVLARTPIPRLVPSVSPRSVLIGAAALTVAGVFAAALVLGPNPSGSDYLAERKLVHDSLRLIWGVYALVVYGCFVLLLRERRVYSRPGDWLPRPALLLVVPLVFLFNGFAPYLGLKTEGAIAMYSNLHTEGGITNHLLLRRPPYLFDYQTRLVRVLESSDEDLQEVADMGLALVEFDFWRQLQERPDASVTYEADGQVMHLTRASEGLAGHEQPLVKRKLLAFKEVDFKRPKVCSH